VIFYVVWLVGGDDFIALLLDVCVLYDECFAMIIQW